MKNELMRVIILDELGVPNIGTLCHVQIHPQHNREKRE
jgi:hypothetical protein